MSKELDFTLSLVHTQHTWKYISPLSAIIRTPIMSLQVSIHFSTTGVDQILGFIRIIQVYLSIPTNYQYLNRLYLNVSLSIFHLNAYPSLYNVVEIQHFMNYYTSFFDMLCQSINILLQMNWNSSNFSLINKE